LFNEFSFFGGESLSELNEECRKTAPRITIPEPEITADNKYKCPLDQAVYDSKQDYDKYCKEEHDVL
jgi:hypothetical protein